MANNKGLNPANRVRGIGGSLVACIAKTLNAVSNLAVTPNAKRRATETRPASDIPTTESAAAPVEDTTPTQPHPKSACLENQCSLTDYADALAKLWKPEVVRTEE